MHKGVDLPVITLNNPVGIIKPYSSVFLEWTFCPLEAITYSFKLPISYRGIEPVGNNRVGEGHFLPHASQTPEGGGRVTPHSSNSSRARRITLTVKATGYDPRSGLPPKSLVPAFYPPDRYEQKTNRTHNRFSPALYILYVIAHY